MSDKTGISWTDATWNPIRGCSRVSEGCRHCYAERVAARFCGPGQPYEGLIKLVARHPRQLVDGGDKSILRVATESRWNGAVRMVPEHLADPLRWKKPRRIFVNSMSDLFHEALTNEQIAAVFGVMAAAPQHTFQVLTKRAKRMREWFEWVAGMVGTNTTTGARMRMACDPLVSCEISASRHGVKMGPRRVGTAHRPSCWPLANVWLGVSVENQAAADERIQELLATPAAVRFLSCEPLIGPVEIKAGLGQYIDAKGNWRTGDGVTWVIAGCESGPGARPCDVAWLRSLRDQCGAAVVPFFLKQAIGTPDDDDDREDPREVGYSGTYVPPLPIPVGAGPGSKLKPGGVIELPYLDGVQHAEFPEARRG